GAFDFEGSDAIAGGFDDVVGAADEPEVAVGVAAGDVAGEVEIAAETGGVFLGVFPVFLEQTEGAMGLDAKGQLAFAARGKNAQVMVEDLHVVTGSRVAHGADADFAAG